MSQGKKRRAQFRKALREAGRVREDRFTEVMNSVAGGGAAPCVCCSITHPVSTLREGLCWPCCNSMVRMRADIPRVVPPRAVAHVEENVVWTDASFAEGVAGLAVVGALGEHKRAVEARTSTQAECLAMRWAMDIADAAGRRDLTFRTDCQAAFRLQYKGMAKMGWKVEQIPRRRNQRADRLAWDARLAA